MANRKESAADVRVVISSADSESSGDTENDVVVSRLQLTKDIDIEVTGGSGRTLPDGYAINEVRYQGTMELVGNRLDLQDMFFDSNGIPVIADGIIITHQDETVTSYTDILVTSEGWEMNEGETTTTTYEFVCLGREHAGLVDNDPTQ